MSTYPVALVRAVIALAKDPPLSPRPMPNPIESQIKDRIETFVQELDLLVRKSALEALRGVLDAGAAPARRRRPPGRRAAAHPAPASTDGLSSRIRAHVAQNPGQTVSQIAVALGGKPAAAKKVIKSLLAEKQIRKAGQRRGTRYYPPGAGRLPGAGSSRKPRRKRGKRRGRKARRVARAGARKTMRRTKPRRKSRATTRRKKPAASRSSKKVIVIPARKRAIPAAKPAKSSTKGPETVPGAPKPEAGAAE